MAFISPVLYEMYAIVMKSRIDNEDRANMPLFFRMPGLLNSIFLWPSFLISHYTGVEKFEVPLTGEDLDHGPGMIYPTFCSYAMLTLI
jgi:solute carrier family 35 protein F5